MVTRVAVTGGRDFNDPALVATALERHCPPDTVLVHGDARGLDRQARDYFLAHGRPVDPFPADWDHLGRRAGHVRNQAMVDSGLDLLIAFPGGVGTANMIDRSRRAGVPVVVIEFTD